MYSTDMIEWDKTFNVCSNYSAIRGARRNIFWCAFTMFKLNYTTAQSGRHLSSQRIQLASGHFMRLCYMSFPSYKSGLILIFLMLFNLSL